MNRTLLNRQGQPVRLGQRLGKGGEGEVFQLADRPDSVAKIYLKAVEAQKATKLDVMAKMRSESVAKLTAWPSELLYDQHGATCGFIMPNVGGYKDIHHLYSPKSRKVEFPVADFRFILRTAANVARAFAAIHETGTVIGDVNHGGVRVSPQALVRLIDCDSFQITSGGSRFLCEVGVPTFTPPELQSKPFKGVLRTPNHDNFGLAVMLFHLLYMGRHPFAGRPLNKEDVPIEKAISELRFPYSGDRVRTRMEPPPHTLHLNQMTDPVAALFLRAFGADGVREGGRPRAQDWSRALEQLEGGLKHCNKNQGHHYPGSLSTCPWCALENNIGIVLFGFTGYISPSGFDLRTIASKIAAIPRPGAEPFPDDKRGIQGTKPSDEVRGSGAGRALKRFGAFAVAVGALPMMAVIPAGAHGFVGIVAVALFLYLLFTSGKGRLKDRLENRRREATNRLDSLRERWNKDGNEGIFLEKRRALEQIIQQLGNMQAFRQILIGELDKTRKQRQLQQYLDSIDIEDAKIPGIGPGRAATLASYGIETAWDISQHSVWAVPGFGKKRVGDLLAWRKKMEAKFTYNPNQPHSAADLAEVDRTVSQKRQEMEKGLLTGANGLEQARLSILRVRESLKVDIEVALRSQVQAEVDIRFLDA